MKRSMQQMFGFFAVIAAGIWMMGCGMEQAETTTASISVRSSALNTISKMTVEVSGKDLSPNILKDLTQNSNGWSGLLEQLPAGTDRLFVARAYSSEGALLFEGEARGVLLEAGKMAYVLIMLQEKQAPGGFENTVPFIDSIATSSTKTTAGQQLQLSVSAHDADQDPLSYTWTAEKGSFTLQNTSQPTWTAPATSGTVTLTVEVSDNRGGKASVDVLITVETNDTTTTATAQVDAIFNQWPRIQKMTSNLGRVDANEQTELEVIATDADSDNLTYAWSSGDPMCEGTFHTPNAAKTTWTAPMLQPITGQCTFFVMVSDGRGGKHYGQLTIQIAPPLLPGTLKMLSIVNAFQSQLTAKPGEQLTFRVEFENPTQSQLSYNWSASSGSLDLPQNQLSQSQIVWTMPSTGTQDTFTILMYATAPDGKQLKKEFTVKRIENTLDTTAPITSTNPGDGAGFHQELNVTLSCLDTQSGCKRIVYTTDGSEPSFAPLNGTIVDGNTASITLSTPLPFQLFTIRFASEDKAGNQETIKEAVFLSY